MPLWHFCMNDFEVVFKIIITIIAKLFDVMTTSPGTRLVKVN